MTYARWVRWIGRHHRAVIAASALLALVSALSLIRLRLDIDVLSMLPRGTPPFDDFKTFVGEFGRLDELLIVVDAAPPDRLRRFVDTLAARLATVDGIAEVHSRLDLQRLQEGMLGTYLFNYIPEPRYAEVAERLTPDAIDRQVAVDRAILAAPFDLSAARAVVEDPLGLKRIAGQHFAEAYAGLAPNLEGGYFAARDGSALLLFVRPTGSPFDIPFTQQLLERVGAAVAAVGAGPDAAAVRVRYAGSYAHALADAATFKADIARYTVLALLGVVAVFYVGYGSLRLLPFVIYPLIVTTLVTFALSLLLFDQLNAVSLSFAAILYGLSIDSGIHFYSLLAEQQRRPGEDATSAVTATLAALGRANVAASATTAAAFAVIGVSVISAVRQLGVMTAVGMAVTTAEFFTLYPALGFVLAGRGRVALRRVEADRLGRWAAAAQRRARLVRTLLLASAIPVIAGAARVRLEPGLEQLRPAASAPLRLEEEIAERFGRTEQTGAVLVRRGGVEHALVDAERVSTVLRGYRERGLAASVDSIDAVLPSERTQRARLARYDALPRAAAVAALRASLQRHGFRPDRFDPFLTAFAAPRDDIVRLGNPALAPLQLIIDHHLRMRGGEVLVATYLDLAPGADWPAVAAQLRRDLPDVELAIAARPLLEAELGAVLHRELVGFLVFAFAGNLVLLVAILRDARIAAAVLAPVALVVAALFAGMALAGVPVDPVNLIVPPLIVGIGVDNGVYLASVAARVGSASAAMRAVGRAITMTALTTIAGFGFLAFSVYPPLAGLGRLIAVGLSLCLITTVVVLPALLRAPRGAPAD